MPPRPAPPVSPEHVETFRRDGFVCVPDLLTLREVDHFGKLVDAAVARRTARISPLAERTAYGQSFLQVINLWEDHPEIRGLTFHPRIGAAAAALLGVKHLRLWHDQALYKEAGGRATDAHQDQPYWPIETRSRRGSPSTTWTKNTGQPHTSPGRTATGSASSRTFSWADPTASWTSPPSGGASHASCTRAAAPWSSITG